MQTHFAINIMETLFLRREKLVEQIRLVFVTRSWNHDDRRPYCKLQFFVFRYPCFRPLLPLFSFFVTLVFVFCYPCFRSLLPLFSLTFFLLPFFSSFVILVFVLCVHLSSSMSCVQFSSCILSGLFSSFFWQFASSFCL